MIEVKVNNLYSTGKVINFDDGEQILIREKLELSMFTDYKFHTVKQGDELTALAYMYYNGTVDDPSKYWWVIADVNNIFNPFTVASYIGQDIVIPDILEVKLIIDKMK